MPAQLGDDGELGSHVSAGHPTDTESHCNGMHTVYPLRALWGPS